MQSSSAPPPEDNHGKAVTGMLTSNEPSAFVDWNSVAHYLRDRQTNSMPDSPDGRILIAQILAKNPPIEVVEEALRVFPDSLAFNVSAFFAASSSCENPDIIRQLVRHSILMQPTTNERPTCPYPWIHLSLVSIDVARVVLNEYPQGVFQVCPISKVTLLDEMLLLGAENFKEYPPHPTWWDKLNLILQVAEYGKVNDSNEENTLHPIHTILRHVLSREELLKKRKMAQGIVWLLHQLRLRDPSCFRIQDSQGDFPLHFALRHKCAVDVGPAQDLIALLVASHPESARACTREHRLPLHMALENAWPCHDVLLKAAPEALQTRDIKTGFYPFQIAACFSEPKNRKRKRKIGTGSLDITYTLLREGPLQAFGLLNGSS